MSDDDVPPAGVAAVPVVGDTEMPVVGVAVQVTDAGWLPSVLSTITSAVADSPPARCSAVGSVRTNARVLGGNVTGPGANDGVPLVRPAVEREIETCHARACRESEPGARRRATVDAQGVDIRAAVAGIRCVDLDATALACVDDDA